MKKTIKACQVKRTGQRNLILFIGEHSEPVNRIKLRCPVTEQATYPLMSANRASDRIEK